MGLELGICVLRCGSVGMSALNPVTVLVQLLAMIELWLPKSLSRNALPREHSSSGKFGNDWG